MYNPIMIYILYVATSTHDFMSNTAAREQHDNIIVGVADYPS